MTTVGDGTSLADALAGRGRPFLVTISGGGSPHLGVVDAALDGDRVVLRGVGTRSRTNLVANHAVTLLWPAPSEDRRSLILDGTAHLDGDVVLVSPTKGILHRPDLDDEGIPAGSDCLPVDLEG